MIRKSNLRAIIIAFVLFVGATFSANAQNDNGVSSNPAANTHNDNGISLHFGVAMPLGDFGDIRTDGYEPEKWILLEEDGRYGGAGTGINLGLKGKFGIGMQGLSIIASADLIWNGMNSDLKDYKEEMIYEMEDDDYDEVTVSFPNYFNIPLFVGLNYQYSLSDKFALWAEGGIGANIRIISPMKAFVAGTYEDYYYDDYGNYYTATIDREQEDKLSYDIATSFAFQIGGGVMINKNISLGLHYYALGSAKVKGEMSEEEIWDGERHFDTEAFKGKRSLSQSLFMVRLGYHF